MVSVFVIGAPYNPLEMHCSSSCRRPRFRKRNGIPVWLAPTPPENRFPRPDATGSLFPFTPRFFSPRSFQYTSPPWRTIRAINFIAPLRSVSSVWTNVRDGMNETANLSAFCTPFRAVFRFPRFSFNDRFASVSRVGFYPTNSSSKNEKCQAVSSLRCFEPYYTFR